MKIVLNESAYRSIMSKVHIWHIFQGIPSAKFISDFLIACFCKHHTKCLAERGLKGINVFIFFNLLSWQSFVYSQILFPCEVNYSLLFCAGLLQSSWGQRGILKCDCKPREIGKGTQQQEK